MFLGACDSPKPPTKAPTVETVETPSPVRAQRDKAAEFLTLSSAVGALSHCEIEAIYVSPIAEEAFYRLAGIGRTYIEAGGKDQILSSLSWMLYKKSTQIGEFVRFFVMKDDTNLVGNDEGIKVTTVEECKMVEKIVLEAMQPGKRLDVKPVAPIETPPAKKTKRDASSDGRTIVRGA